MTEVGDRLAAVRARIAAACARAGRALDTVRLVAVSKGQGVEKIREAYAVGQRDFGENYVQELLAKADATRDLVDLRWHFIGHLQSNKCKHVVRVAHAVQTIDGEPLARELGKRAVAAGRVLDVMVQVNVGDEASKSGCTVAAAPRVIDAVRSVAGVRLVGVMAIPPHAVRASAAT